MTSLRASRIDPPPALFIFEEFKIVESASTTRKAPQYLHPATLVFLNRDSIISYQY